MILVYLFSRMLTVECNIRQNMIIKPTMNTTSNLFNAIQSNGNWFYLVYCEYCECVNKCILLVIVSIYYENYTKNVLLKI